jgi:acylphosphatase
MNLETSKRETSKPDLIARRYTIRGRVQGVGFRFFVEGEARPLGITGWVRNNMDGDVEVFAQGTNAQLSRLHELLRRGPRSARVDGVGVEVSEPDPDLKVFRIEGSW